jgi:hypothetical protein
MLRRISEPKRDEFSGEWRKLHNEELNELYCPPNIARVFKSRIIRWAGNIARMGERTGVYRVLMENHERKRPTDRSRRRCDDNIKMDLQEEIVGYELDRAGSGYGPVAGTAECGVPSGSIKCGDFLE